MVAQSISFSGPWLALGRGFCLVGIVLLKIGAWCLGRAIRAAKHMVLILAVLLAFEPPAMAGKLPRLLRLDGVLWEIKLVPAARLDQLLGEKGYTAVTLCAHRRIEIRRGISAWEMADTVLHEVQHAFTCERGEGHNEKLCDHQGIYFSAPKWRSLIRDNQELIRYIQDADPPPAPEWPWPRRPDGFFSLCPPWCFGPVFGPIGRR